jgi:hypothetical protein
MSYRYMKFAGQVRWLALSLALGATGAEAATANPDDVRSVAEDFAPIPVALSGSFSGVSGTATYTYLGSTGVTAATVGLNPATGDVTLTAVADANGSQTLTFQVKDDGGDADRPWRLGERRRRHARRAALVDETFRHRFAERRFRIRSARRSGRTIRSRRRRNAPCRCRPHRARIRSRCHDRRRSRRRRPCRRRSRCPNRIGRRCRP